MAISMKLEQKLVQRQIQKLSQVQITTLNYLAMGNEALRNEIYKAVSENPALEIVSESSRRGNFTGGENYSTSFRNSETSDQYQQIIENQQDYGETLQAHLLHQLNAMKISEAEQDLCTKLIYNLDKNGFYGSMLSPETFLPRKNPAAEKELLERCLKMVQSLDPVGTCCRAPEESLLIQARLSENPDPLALFILDGHLDFMNPPDAQKISRKLIDYKKNLQKKAFADTSVIDSLSLDEEAAATALKFILSLNPHPAQGYNSEAGVDTGRPDVVLIVTKENGPADDDYSRGLVSLNSDYYFQIKYAIIYKAIQNPNNRNKPPITSIIPSSFSLFLG